MIITSVTIEVANYSEWKSLFDLYAPGRKAMGSKGGIIYKKNDSNVITVIMKWSDKKKAIAFHESKNLENAMKKSGVVSIPIVRFYDEVEAVEI